MRIDPQIYGYAQAAGYNISTDLVLSRAEFQSAHIRQRRTFMHNASLVTMTYRLPADKAKSLNELLQAQPSTQFFTCPIISGNDSSAPCAITEAEVRRTTPVTVARIPLTNIFTLSFSAETKWQEGFEEKSVAAEYLPPQTYPADLPLPQADGFTGAHGERNVTTYSLTYMMNAATLARWLDFAGFVGTAWFLHPMVSINVPCGYEMVRFISNPAQALAGPDLFSVSVEAETMPAAALMDLVVETEGECTYNGESSYDDPAEIYDCSGVTPPQGEFTMPAGLVTISQSDAGPAPLISASILKLKSDGTVEGIASVSPPWAAWHTAPETLPKPAVSCSQVMQFSIDDGATWRYTTPVAGGYWISLKENDVWFKYEVTANYDTSSGIDFVLNFEADHLPTPTLLASASVRMTISADVTANGSITNGLTFADGYEYTSEGTEPITVSAGVMFSNQGYVFAQTTSENIGNWFLPAQIGAGVGLYLLLNKTSGISDIAGQGVTRTALNANVHVSIVSPERIGSAFCSWFGTYEIWNAPTGGQMLGGGFINLQSSVTP